MGQNGPHQANDSRPWEYQKQSSGQKDFLFMYRLTELRNLQEPFIWMVVSYTISSTTSRQLRAKVTGMTIVKKLVNYSGSFEDTAKFNWEPMESFENRRCPCVFVTVCDNPSQCFEYTVLCAC